MTTVAIDQQKKMKTKLIQEEKVRYPKEILEKEVLKIAIVIVIEVEDTLMIGMIPNPGKDTGQDLVKKLSTRWVKNLKKEVQAKKNREIK